MLRLLLLVGVLAVPDDEVPPQVRAWTQAALRTGQVELVWTADYSNDVDVPRDDEPTSAVVNARVTTPAGCKDTYVELSWSAKGPVRERVMGSDCCDHACPLSTVAQAMARWLSVCSGERKDSLVALLPPVGVKTDWRDNRGQKAKGKTRELDGLCGPSVAKFTCDERSGACETKYVGEWHRFVWRRKGASLLLTELSSRVDN